MPFGKAWLPYLNGIGLFTRAWPRQGVALPNLAWRSFQLRHSYFTDIPNLRYI
jgi:hypothetical protein